MQNELEFHFVKRANTARENPWAMTVKKSYGAILISALLTLSPCHEVSAVTAKPLAASMPEQQAVLDLVPVTPSTRQVVQSGSWSNPATWNGGVLPTASQNIYVPAGKSLLVDILNDVSLGTVRVDGIITFATTQNVRIKLDTLVVSSTGSFEIGSETSRVPSSNKIEVIVANHGPINRNWDSSNISRGILLQGKTRIYGADKSAFHALAVKPDAGTTTITLGSVPTGWAAGDMIAITSTQYRPKKLNDTFYQTEDELKRIKAISGNTITLGSVSAPNTAEPLQYSHIPDIANMPVYVANLSRNVVFSGEGGDQIPASQRGHFMVMHTSDVIIKGAGFYFLGRTDKSKPINDFKLDKNGNRIVTANGSFVPDANTNPRGRYPVHFHHTGVSDITIPPAVCSGNAVFSSAGWGFVNHTSNVTMENNASYDVFGSHYVSEDGNELGAFKNNIAIKSEGIDQILKTGTQNHDVGGTGHGLWLESRNLAVENNVVSGAQSAGLVYFQRNPITPPSELDIPQKNLLTPNKGITKSLPTIHYSHIPITDNKNNTVLASGYALKVIKSNHNQGHDVRNMIQSLKGYSIQSGIELQYTEKYTYTDLELVASPSTRPWHRGFSADHSDRDIAIINANIANFVHPILTGTTFHGLSDETDIVFTNVLVDGRPIIPEIDIQKFVKGTVSNYNPALHKVLNLNDTINTSALSFVQPINTVNNFALNLTPFTVNGTKTDSLGEIAFSSKWNGTSLRNILKKGYYTRPDGSKVALLPDIIADRLNGQAQTVNTVVNIVNNYSFLGPYLGVLPN